MQRFTGPRLINIGVCGLAMLGLAACNGSGLTIKSFEQSELVLQVNQEHTQLVTLSSAADEDGETVDISNSDPASVEVDVDKLFYAQGELQKSVKITGKAETQSPVVITFKLRDRSSSRTLEVMVGDGGGGGDAGPGDDASVEDMGNGDASTSDMSVNDTGAEDATAADTSAPDASNAD